MEKPVTAIHPRKTGRMRKVEPMPVWVCVSDDCRMRSLSVRREAVSAALVASSNSSVKQICQRTKWSPQKSMKQMTFWDFQILLQKHINANKLMSHSETLSRQTCSPHLLIPSQKMQGVFGTQTQEKTLIPHLLPPLQNLVRHLRHIQMELIRYWMDWESFSKSKYPRRSMTMCGVSDEERNDLQKVQRDYDE